MVRITRASSQSTLLTLALAGALSCAHRQIAPHEASPLRVTARAAPPGSPPIYVERCDPDSREAAEARDALDRLDRRVQSLTDSVDVRPMRQELWRLIDSRCFELAALTGDTPLGLWRPSEWRWWWTEGGAHAWLSSYVAIDALAHGHRVLFPADPRADWSVDHNREQASVPLLCDSDDAACGTETASWSRRAEGVLQVRPRGGVDLQRLCGELGSHEVEADRYQRFIECIDSNLPRGDAMPLARFRAPRAGWFVTMLWPGALPVVPRPPELRVIDLTTGSAWRVLETSVAGNVRYTVSSGRVSLEAAREAAWFMLITPTLGRGARVRPNEFNVPVGFIPRMRASSQRSVRRGGGINEGPSIAYRWIADGRVIRGAIPSAGYAELLLEAAQASWVSACDVAAPPSRVPDPTDARPELEDPFWSALAAGVPSRICEHAR